MVSVPTSRRCSRAAVQPCSRIFGVFQRGQHPQREDQHVFARRGERDLTTAALEQRHADVAFKLFDLHRDGRGCQVQHLGGFAEAQVLGHFTEHA